MSLSSGDWLYTELERAAEEYRSMPEWTKPVVTAPGSGTSTASPAEIGFQVPNSADR